MLSNLSGQKMPNYTSKLVAILDDEDINCITALLAFEVGDITSLEITKRSTDSAQTSPPQIEKLSQW